MIDADKAALRRCMRALRRDRANELAPDEAGGLLAGHLLAALPLRGDEVVSGFWPFRAEIDPRPLMRDLAARGHRIGLPITPGPGEPLAFRRWIPGMALQRHAMGIAGPPARSPAIVPDLLLVPLLAVDRHGFRLGYGGGFYDRTLARLRGRRAHAIVAVGLAYAAQVIETVPRGPADQPVDWIASERGAWPIVPGANGDRTS